MVRRSPTAEDSVADESEVVELTASFHADPLAATASATRAGTSPQNDYDSLRSHISVLEDSHRNSMEELASSLAVMRARAQATEKERDHLLARVAALETSATLERTALEAERAGLQKERNILQAERFEIDSKRESLRMQRAALEKALSALPDPSLSTSAADPILSSTPRTSRSDVQKQKQRDDLLARVAELETSAAQERAKLDTERSALQKERAALKAERFEIDSRRESLRMQRAAFEKALSALPSAATALPSTSMAGPSTLPTSTTRTAVPPAPRPDVQEEADIHVRTPPTRKCDIMRLALASNSRPRATRSPTSRKRQKTRRSVSPHPVRPRAASTSSLSSLTTSSDDEELAPPNKTLRPAGNHPPPPVARPPKPTHAFGVKLPAMLLWDAAGDFALPDELAARTRTKIAARSGLATLVGGPGWEGVWKWQPPYVPPEVAS
ncbi:hypothetical protein FB451DRAFT_1243760 [Mycena latifolia]|nr:hypothetical protein FB451DRAFT_1243760 [Mycena latifolia]